MILPIESVNFTKAADCLYTSDLRKRQNSIIPILRDATVLAEVCKELHSNRVTKTKYLPLNK